VRLLVRRLSPRARRSIRTSCLVFAAILLLAAPALARTVRIEWAANTEPDFAGYIVRYGTSPGAYTAAVDVGSRTDLVLTLSDTKTYYAVIEAYTTAGLHSAPSAEIEIPISSCATTLSSSSGWVPVDGGSLNIGVNAMDGCSWSAASAANWISVIGASTATGSGNVSLAVDSNSTGRTRSGTVALGGRSYTVAQAAVADVLSSSVALKSVSADILFPTAVGRTVTWTAHATGGDGDYLYRFMLYSPTAGWQVLQEYSTNNVATWTAPAVGRYALQVWVRSSTSSRAYDAYRSFGAFDVNVATATSVTLVPTSATYVAGTPVVWSAAATGGVAPLQYQFLVYNASTGWVIAQPYGAASRFTWRPLLPGVYIIQVWARSAGSWRRYESYASSAVRVAPRATVIIEAATNVALPVAPGVPITWNVTAAGPAPLEYEFWVRDSALRWQKFRAYGASSSGTWTPAAAGSYVVQVRARQRGLSVPYESYANTSGFTVGVGPVNGPKLTSNQVFPLPANTPITWRARASGGSAALEYQFWRYDNGGWVLARPYGPIGTYSWTPNPEEVGPHAIQVWVRSVGSNVAYERCTGSGTFFIVP
jgi:hypothetical protein